MFNNSALSRRPPQHPVKKEQVHTWLNNLGKTLIMQVHIKVNNPAITLREHNNK